MLEYIFIFFSANLFYDKTSKIVDMDMFLNDGCNEWNEMRLAAKAASGPNVWPNVVEISAYRA